MIYVFQKNIIESINSFLNILLEVLLFVNIVFKSGINNTVVFLKPFLFSALNTLVSDRQFNGGIWIHRSHKDTRSNHGGHVQGELVFREPQSVNQKEEVRTAAQCQ